MAMIEKLDDTRTRVEIHPDIDLVGSVERGGEMSERFIRELMILEAAIVTQFPHHTVEHFVEYQKVCSHCGAEWGEWAEDDNLYNGGCCSQDEDEEEKRNPLS